MQAAFKLAKGEWKRSEHQTRRLVSLEGREKTTESSCTGDISTADRFPYDSKKQNPEATLREVAKICMASKMRTRNHTCLFAASSHNIKQS